MTDSYNVILDQAAQWSVLVFNMLPNILVAVLVLIVFWLLGRSSRRGVITVSGRFTDSEAMRRLLGTLVYIVVLIVGLVIALEVLNLGTAVTSLLAGAGIVGLAVGLAFQDLIANFIAGSMLAVRRPFRVGDLIDSNGHRGTVTEINLRATHLRAPQGEYVVIPNKDVFQNPIINYNATDIRRVDIVCGVSYNDDLDKVRSVVTDVLQGQACRCHNRDAECYFTEFGDSSINFVGRFWVDFKKQPDFLEARNGAIIALKRAFDEQGIDIPFPTRTLFTRGE